MDPKSLPIYELASELRRAVRFGSPVIVRAPTGSGKSTQVPQILADDPGLVDGQIVVLEPRRLAARLLAARVASERGARLGGEVGFQIRLEDVSSRDTRIKFVTEGVLLRRLQSDPSLRGVGAILFDEFHERHLYSDLSLACVQQIRRSSRPDLKVVVMSATLDVELLQKYFGACDVLTSGGRTHPVDIRYLERRPDDRMFVWDLAAREWDRLAAEHSEGDFLIFMPGAYEIQRTVRAIENSRRAKDFVVRPLHGELPVREQDAALAPCEKRRVIVSTNVAETSLTIDGVRLVIDSGLARIPRYDPRRGINTLMIDPISRSSADQRAGRAGRTAPGVALRLWTEQDHRGRPWQELPEIRRVDLAEVVLSLKGLGVRDFESFPWIEPPDPLSLLRAGQLLVDLGAVDPKSGDLTPSGRRMLVFPAHPRHARLLMAAEESGCVRDVALIAALLQTRDLFVRNAGGDAEKRRDTFRDGAEGSDFFVRMKAWEFADGCDYDLDACIRHGIHAQTAREAGRLRQSFLRLAREDRGGAADRPFDPDAVRKCLLLGFIDHLSKRVDCGTLRCDIVHGRKGTLRRETTVGDAPLFVAGEVQEIEGREVQVMLSLATAIEPDWLRELFPGDWSEKVDVQWDRAAGRVTASRQVLFRDLVMESKPLQDPPADEAASMLAKAVRAGDIALPKWDEAVEQWICRVNFLAKTLPDRGLPVIDDEARDLMLAQICHGEVSARGVKDKAVWPVVKSWLTYAQQELLDKQAPERIQLPTGHRARVTYYPSQPPSVAAKLQDLYDVREHPAVAMGRAPLVVQILAPNFRPVQITSDLAGFWRDVYPGVKQELRRKYPKHEWR